MTALWAVVAAVGLAVGRPQETTVGPIKSDPVLEAARGWALRYSQTLPDFVCTEFIRRYQNWTGTDFQLDTLTFRVSFYHQREAYELVAQNQGPSHQPFESPSGSISKGEFGSALRFVFDPESAAVFEPQKPERIQRRAVAMYGYAVRLENSHYALWYGPHRILTAYHGRVYIDPSTSRVLRLTMEVDPPPDFPIRETATAIDYDFRAIGGEQYLLPVRAEVHTFEALNEKVLKALKRFDVNDAPGVRWGVQYRNIEEFRNYRKFSTDSKLTFH